jgi:hypothetical protein
MPADCRLADQMQIAKMSRATCGLSSHRHSNHARRDSAVCPPFAVRNESPPAKAEGQDFHVALLLRLVLSALVLLAAVTALLAALMATLAARVLLLLAGLVLPATLLPVVAALLVLLARLGLAALALLVVLIHVPAPCCGCSPIKQCRLNRFRFIGAAVGRMKLELGRLGEMSERRAESARYLRGSWGTPG